MLELPMTVTPLLRLPVIGTSLVTAPEWLRRRLVAGALRGRFFNLELHGIESSWGTQERILVCMTPRADATVMLASGRRIPAGELSGENAPGLGFRAAQHGVAERSRQQPLP